MLRGVDLLPIGMLRRLIRASGSAPAHLLLRQQLSTGLDLVSSQLDRMEALLQPPAPPPPPPSRREADEPPPEESPRAAPDPELVELRARLAALEARLGRR